MSEEKINQEDEEENSVEKHEENDSVDPDSVGELADALDVEDPEERKQLIAKFSRITSSPVPPPKVLKGYDEVVDGGAKWLMDYTKAEPDDSRRNRFTYH